MAAMTGREPAGAVSRVWSANGVLVTEILRMRRTGRIGRATIDNVVVYTVNQVV
jgi:hypothetical protein